MQEARVNFPVIRWSLFLHMLSTISPGSYFLQIAKSGTEGSPLFWDLQTIDNFFSLGICHRMHSSSWGLQPLPLEGRNSSFAEGRLRECKLQKVELQGLSS